MSVIGFEVFSITIYCSIYYISSLLLLEISRIWSLNRQRHSLLRCALTISRKRTQENEFANVYYIIFQDWTTYFRE